MQPDRTDHWERWATGEGVVRLVGSLNCSLGESLTGSPLVLVHSGDAASPDLVITVQESLGADSTTTQRVLKSRGIRLEADRYC